ncbi:DUF4870 domain-containing protein [Arthrobacter monumenti]
MANPARGGSPEGNQSRPPYAPYQGMSADAQPLTASEDRQWATMSHFGGILGFLPSLVIYLVMRDRGPFTAQESKEALNFTLPPTILAVLANLLALIDGLGSIFAVVAALIWLALTVFAVKAGIHVNKGEPHRYALNLRLIK